MQKEKFVNPREKGGIPSDNVHAWYKSLREGGLSEKEIEEIIGKTNPEFVVRQHDPKGEVVSQVERMIANIKMILQSEKVTLPPDKEENLRQSAYGLMKKAREEKNTDTGYILAQLLDYAHRL